jgi:hypothetical protein
MNQGKYKRVLGRKYLKAVNIWDAEASYLLKKYWVHSMPVPYRMFLYLLVLLNSQTWPIGTQLWKYSLLFFEQTDSGSGTGSEKICSDPNPII